MRYVAPVALCLMVLGLVGVRLIHLDADTPPGLSWSAGLYVDEGYKTLSARNVVLFDSPHWHPGDDYHGWDHQSPIMHWLFVLAFTIGAPDVESARIVTILFFGLLLACFALSYREYSPLIVALGLVLLGTQSTLFFYSRIALLELPLAVAVFCTLFLLKHIQSHIKGTVVLVVLSVICMLGIKITALLYFAPVYGAILIASLVKYGRRVLRPKPLILLAVLLAVGTFLLYPLAYEIPSVRSLTVSKWLANFSGSPLFTQNRELSIFGTLSGLALVLLAPRKVFGNAYLLGVVFIAIVPPVMLAAFDYDPPRYYVPFLPAYALLVVELLGHVQWRKPDPGLTGIGLRVVIVLFVLFGFYKNVRASRWPLSRFFNKPTYQARSVRESLEEHIGPGQSVMGDWAPFLTLGTNVRSLYMNKDVNVAANAHRLEVPFFLHCFTHHSEVALRDLGQNTRVSVGAPIRLPDYNRAQILLYPLRYAEQPPE